MRATVKVAMDEEQAREQERVLQPNSARVARDAAKSFRRAPFALTVRGLSEKVSTFPQTKELPEPEWPRMAIKTLE